MATFVRGTSALENSKPTSRRRHHHSKPDSRSRRSYTEHHVRRPSPSRQIQWSAPSPMTIIGGSILLEHSNGITMERTPSGNSIMSDTPYEQSPNYTLTYRDSEAARMVKSHFERLPTYRKHERILRKIIHPTPSHPFDDTPLDDNALDSILTSADSVFFSGVLSGRVQWEWSSQDRYRTELVGTTALRRCKDREGFETLIVLSSPFLRNPKYDRRLLLSAFLHELIHCYLFILCGFEARKERGHTKGFHAIAAIIDRWVGEGYLSLCNMKANLSLFRRACGDEPREEAFPVEPWRGHAHEGCNLSPRPESRMGEGSEIVMGGFY